MLGQVIDETCRREHGRLVAILLAAFDDFDLAEDALQDAYTRALATWPRTGPPVRPWAWLLQVARRAAIDRVRRRREAPLAGVAEPIAPPTDDPEAEATATSGIADERLRLLFMCCHPVLAPPAQVALTLRALSGLRTREVARALLEPETTTAQRLVRAKRTLHAAGVPLEVPTRAELPALLAAVLQVLSLVFNEGNAATTGPALLRLPMAGEAIRLARLLVPALPNELAARALLALLLLHHARRATRVDDRHAACRGAVVRGDRLAPDRGTVPQPRATGADPGRGAERGGGVRPRYHAGGGPGGARAPRGPRCPGRPSPPAVSAGGAGAPGGRWGRGAGAYARALALVRQPAERAFLKCRCASLRDVATLQA